MSLDESSTCMENVYGWICGLKTEFSNGPTAWLDLDKLRSGRMIVLYAVSIGKQISLDLWLDSKDSGDYVALGELGTCLIEECSKKKMRQNLLPLLSRLCIYAFLGVTHKDIVDLKRRGSKKKMSKEDIEEFLRLEIEPGTIEARVYKRAFNNIFYAACYSCLIHGIKQDNEIEYHKAELKEFTAKTLQIIGPEATESLMKSLVSKYNRILSEYQGGSMDKLKFSSSLSLGKSWIIRCYCPRLEMERTIQYEEADKHLEDALSHQLLRCMLHLDHVVNIQEHCIKVELKIGNLHCKALQLDSYRASNLENEWYFPAKISLTMGPECTSRVYYHFLGLSSPNPSTRVSKAKTNEMGRQVEAGSGMPSLNLGVSDDRTTSSTHMMKNWRFEAAMPKATQGRLDWTLHDNSYGMPVFTYTPCSINDNHYKAFKAFADGVGSDRPFTQDGGVIFGGDMYGTPMTWCLHRELEGETLKWFVELEIWLAYYPNKYRTKYMEIRYQKFREVVELSLVQSV